MTSGESPGARGGSQQEHLSSLPHLQVHPSDWLFPCDSTSVSATCYVWLFAVFIHYHPWRHEGLFAHAASSSGLPNAQDVAHVCLGKAMLEGNLRGCIFGFSSTFYYLFDAASYAPDEDDEESWMATCGDAPEVVTPRSFHVATHCPLLRQGWQRVEEQPLWARDQLPASNDSAAVASAPARSRTLLRWCTHYLGEGGGDDGGAGGGADFEVERGRWMACVAGSLFYLAIPIHREGLPLESVQR